MRVYHLVLFIVAFVALHDIVASASNNKKKKQPKGDPNRCGTRYPGYVLKFIDRVTPWLESTPIPQLPDPATAQNVAVLVEPREDPCIRFVVRNVMHYLPEGEWALQIMHGRDNLEYIKEQLKDFDVDRIVFSSFYDVIRAIERKRDMPKWLIGKWDGYWKDLNATEKQTGEWNINREVYSQGLLQPEFWRPLVAEEVLIFQTDSWLCKHGVEQYTHWDYVGALWRMCTMGEDHIFWPHCLAGNGGLSLRSRAKSLLLTETKKRQTLNEDYQFALWFRDHGKEIDLSVPNIHERREIFSEELMPVNADMPYGLHKAWHYQSMYSVKPILDLCMGDLNPANQPQEPAASPTDTQEEHNEL